MNVVGVRIGDEDPAWNLVAGGVTTQSTGDGAGGANDERGEGDPAHASPS